MNTFLIAQVGSIAHYAILVVAAIAICALVALFLRYSGIDIPPVVAGAFGMVRGAIVVFWQIIPLPRSAGRGNPSSPPRPIAPRRQGRGVPPTGGIRDSERRSTR